MMDSIDTQRLFLALSTCATNALYGELDATPKPGLVDKRNNGAHDDMDYNTFCVSIEALRPYFEHMCALSYNCHDYASVASRIRIVGINAENAMRKATHGVNTHKGAIFCIGLFLSAICMDFAPQTPLSVICDRVAHIAEQLSSAIPQRQSNGAKVCKEYAIAGAMENALSGFTTVFPTTLLTYALSRKICKSVNDAKVKTLLYIMSFLPDTNVYHRGKEEGARYVKQQSRYLYENFDIAEVEKFDDILCQNGISCGGSADMLALTLMVSDLIGYLITLE